MGLHEGREAYAADLFLAFEEAFEVDGGHAIRLLEGLGGLDVDEQLPFVI